jgi:hypothetical protein
MSTPAQIDRTAIASRAGSVRSAAKAEAARANGKRGGRPADPRIKAIMAERGVSRQRAHQILRSLAT